MAYRYSPQELQDLMQRCEAEGSLGNADCQASAARFIMALLGEANVPLAFMGGFSLQLLGYLERETSHVDVAVDMTMKELQAFLKPVSYLFIPRRHAGGPVRVFWSDVENDLLIPIDIRVLGSAGVPRDLRREIEDVGPTEDPVRVLSLRQTLKNKLHLFDVRQEEQDLKDLVALFCYDGWRIRLDRTEVPIKTRRSVCQSLRNHGLDVEICCYVEQMFGLDPLFEATCARHGY